MKGRYISALLIVIMLLSLASCSSDAPTADDEIREFTSEVCTNVIKGDYGFFEDNAILDEEKDRDLDDVLDVYYDNDMWDNYQKKISDYIKESLSYEIDYNSAFASHARKTGEIDVYFKYVDYKGLYKSGKAKDVKDYYKQLKKYDKTVEKKVHITFVMERKHWKLADFEKIFVDLFEWKDFHYEFSKDYSSYISDVEWYHSDGSTGTVFQDVIYLELDIFVDDRSVDLSTDCYYKVFFDGEEIYEADVMAVDYLERYYYCLYNGYLLNGSKELDAGEYTFTVYDFQDNEIFTETCTVENNGGKNGDGASQGSGRLVEYGESKFTPYITSSGWYQRSADRFEYDIWYDSLKGNEFSYYFELLDDSDNVIYTSETLEVPSNSSYIELYVTRDDAGVDSLTSSVGSIKVYDGDGVIILTDYN